LLLNGVWTLRPAPSDHEARSHPPQERVRHPRRPSRFAMFDTFDDEAGRDAHLNSNVAAALMEKTKGGDLFVVRSTGQPQRRRSR
jgi:hypothetical protein